MQYQVSVFTGTDASQTRAVSYVEKFSTELITGHLWAPGIFANGLRADSKLESISLLVLDVDEGCTLEEAPKLFGGYRHVIGTSRSHGIEKNGVVADRFRVILFLDRPATSDKEFKDYWFAAFAKWPFIDKACKDSARFFYPCKEIVSVNEDGAMFDERAVATPKSTSQPAAATRQRGKLSRATIDFLISGAQPGSWHHRFFKAATDFKEQGFDIEHARLKLTSVTGFLDDHDEQTLTDVFENRETRYEPRGIGQISDWPIMIEHKGNEFPDSKHPDNLKHLIEKLGFKLRFNEMDEAIYNGDKLLSDADLNFIWGQSKRQKLDAGKDFIAAEIMNIAAVNRYHPVKSVIESRPWDGADHIGALYKTLAIVGDLNYEIYLRKWLMGIVAKLYRPGSQNLTLTFVGKQGIGKSRWFTKLAVYEKAFGEGACDPGNKDHELRHLTHLIWHIPELDYTTGKRETGALKDYLTRDFVSVRPAFARYTREGRSICSFAASCNTDEFLVDPTGNRRFLVIPLDDINPDHDADIQQVFAQAKALVDRGESWWLDKGEIVTLADQNAQFEVRDPLTSFIETMEAGDDPMTVLEVCALAGRTEPTFAELTRAGATLKRRGFKKQRQQVANVRRWVYMVKNPNGISKMRSMKPL